MSGRAETEPTGIGAESPLLLSRDQAGVRLLKLNRPAKRNALSHQLMLDLLAALATAESDNTVRVIVVTGAGESFCAGADLGERLGAAQEAQTIARAQAMARLQSAFVTCSKPVLCAVNGHALGAGCGLAVASDWSACTPTATFGYPEVSVGVLPALVTPGLVRRVGAALAFDLLSTGRRLSAQEAKASGLVATVVADGDVVAETMRLATTLAIREPSVIGQIKTLIGEASRRPFEDAMRLALEANIASRLTRREREQA
jgi:enoyl-CoA hydratase/carnithine racemase